MPTAQISLAPSSWLHVKTQRQYPLTPLPWDTKKPLLALAAIGNPQRFYATLKRLGLHPQTLSFNDHHLFTENDFREQDNKTLLMTTKDAVKCTAFAGDHWWALEVAVDLPKQLVDEIVVLAQQVNNTSIIK